MVFRVDRWSDAAVENRKADHIAPYFSKEKGSPMVYSALFKLLAIFMPMPNMLNMPLILALQLLMHVTFGRVRRKIAQKGAKPSKKCPKKCSLRGPNH